MIGFSLEFKRWYITLRGPKGRVYLCTGFAKHIPIFISPAQAYKFEQAADWDDDETDDELLDTLRSIR